MDFKEFLPEENEEIEEPTKVQEKVSQSQVYDVITSKKPDWQQIIYDLIQSEQLDPLDIDIVLLTRRYFEKIEEMEQGDFYISSKVLLAAAILLRIKSEFLLNKYIKSIDDILFGRKEEKKYSPERIIIEEDQLPVLIPKTPLPRAKRVTLDELMFALNKAINTESRRIKREVAVVRAKKLSEVDFPTFRKIDLKDRIRLFYAKVLTLLKKKSIGPAKDMNKVGYTNLIGKEKEEKLASFLPLLHLSNTKKLWLEQDAHLAEIYIFLYNYFDKNRDCFIEELEEDIEEMKEELGMTEQYNEDGTVVDLKPKVDPNSTGMMDLESLETEIEQKLIEEKVADKIVKEIEAGIEEDLTDVEKDELREAISHDIESELKTEEHDVGFKINEGEKKHYHHNLHGYKDHSHDISNENNLKEKINEEDILDKKIKKIEEEIKEIDKEKKIEEKTGFNTDNAI